MREIARGDDLPDLPTWDQLRAALAGGTDLFSLEALEARREDVLESFLRCRLDQIQEKKGQKIGSKALTNEDAPLTPPRTRTPSNSAGSDKAHESNKEALFQPTLDEAANVSPVLLSDFKGNSDDRNRIQAHACYQYT